MNGRIQRTGEQSAAYIEKTLLMMDVQKGQYFSLNGMATRIWELLEHPTTQAALIAQLLDEYEVTEETCGAEVEAFLAELRHHKLLGGVA
ncbi:MAG: PqqD family protein [Acidobacteriia bacterium]|nr:PqqD family protein [Terriglobia bacterium]